MKPVHVLLSVELLPHYRRDLFHALENDERISIKFAAGPGVKDRSIPAMPACELRSAICLRNRYLNKLLWQSGLLRSVLRLRPEVIIFAGDPRHLSTWATALIARILGIKVLLWTIGWHRPDGGIRRFIRLAFFRLADRLLLYGHIGRRFGIAAGYPVERMRVILNSSAVGQEMEKPPTEDAKRSDIFPPNDANVATAVLRLIENKNLDLLLEAAAELNRNGRKLHVLLVGDGPERERLRETADRLGVDLYMPGAVYNEPILEEIYRRTTVSVIPGPAGLTVLQSFRFGVPVVTHDNDSDQRPEAEAITDGVTGSRFRQGSATSLAQEITRWIVEEPEAKLSTATACRRVVEREWSATAQCDRIVSAVLEVLAVDASPDASDQTFASVRRPKE